MASTKDFLDFVLGQLAPIGVTARAMMGEYVLYLDGKVIGGVYDDRLLIKATPSALNVMRSSPWGEVLETPYPGAKPMLAVDPDDRELLCRAVLAAAADLPEPKPKKPKKPDTEQRS